MKNRHTYIGGSDVAAILGLNRYKTPYEVWDEKKNGNNPFTGNAATEWGKKLEPVLIDHYEQEEGCKVEERNSLYWPDKNIPLACHPDGIRTYPRRNVEAKTVSTVARKHWQNELPLEYYCQVQHEMFCTNTEDTDFICLSLDDRDYFKINIKRDNDFIAKQNEYLISWWERFIVGDEIPIKQAIDFEKENPEGIIYVEASEEILVVFKNLVELKAKIKHIEDLKELCEGKIKVAIGSGTDLMSGINTLATWRPYTQARIDTTKIKEEAPEVFFKYAKETTGRKLLIKQK